MEGEVVASGAAVDLTAGVPVERLPEGGLLEGKVGAEDVVLARRGTEFFAVGAACTHYGGPLGQGVMVDGTLRCPLHHACFSLQTGEALHGPAFDPIPRWRVERVGDSVFVREKLPAAPRKRARSSPGDRQTPGSVVIVGGGGAGFAAADMLRREGYDGPVKLISADEFPPYDRPNLSKDYLAGTAPDEWIPLKPPSYYPDQGIDLAVNSRVVSLDVSQKQLRTADGAIHAFDRLLLATGAEPVRLPVPGAQESQLSYLRTYADCRALVVKAASAKQVVIVGGSFIGLEVAASLRARGLAVHVVAREKEPLERVLGHEVGRFIRELHEAHGVVFHLQDTIIRLEGRRAILRSGTHLDADLLVIGVGVRAATTLAEQAGLKVDRGVVVDEYLETSAPGIFAAGDIALWPDPRSGERVRVEHWVVAERLGQVAARNLLGRRQRFDAVPFFWTQQHGVSIRYTGHALAWDETVMDGSFEAGSWAVTYKRAGRTLAVATVSRDLQSLKAEVAMETSHDHPT
jgi:NADPH-dependent 2,4-dienoyl-CoA reductase/sulfur reductase-like enzyme/nitrite reductase/ring-hydroxylating ferredoxin subunit